MKVILLQDVKNVGQKFEITDVKPGFARNFLFAQGLAEAVTKSNARRIADLGKKREEEKKHQEELLEKALAKVAGVSIDLTRSANEEGHLYAGVTKEELAEELTKSCGTIFLPEHIELEKPIKTTGEHIIRVEFKGKDAKFAVKIDAE